MQTTEFGVTTQKRTQFVDISTRIAELVKNQGWRNGVLTIFSPHTTAGITINENADPDVTRDMEWFSNRLIPQSTDFRHAEGNSDAHLKASFFGSSVQIIVREERLWLGTWQAIYFCEFDGPRQRRVYVAFSGD
jgi:secondary thiamine-phosphate synthase enzyme